MLTRLFGQRADSTAIFATPPSTRVYAIGDIHGRADLLRRLREMIAADAADADCARKLVVYVGDYVDRGQASSDVIDILLDEPLPDIEAVHLKGNHEDFMLEFLADYMVGPLWFMNGGDATLRSYGVGNPDVGDRDRRLQLLQAELQRKLPQRHLDFLRSLDLYHTEGDYLFVHAGIRPGLAIDQQKSEDLLWIRDDFLRSNADHGLCVVHGHTITRAVSIGSNRIGIDTGAYATDTLSCVVLEDRTRRLLQT